MATGDITIRWGDATYTAGDLTAADMIAMERQFGVAFPDLDFRSIEVAAWMVWLVRRHDDKDIELDAVTTVITFADLERGVAEEEQKPVPPTSNSRKPARRSGASGSRGTKRSSA